MNDQLGKIITGEAHRDAIHIAIAPATAAHNLSAGQHVGVAANGHMGAASSNIGIVDPFLTAPVLKGERFWLLLYPNTITTLRHEWAHPAFFGDKPVASESEAWIRRYAETMALGYEELLEAADSYVRHGDYLVQGGRFEGECVPDDFWPHYEVVSGKSVPDANRGASSHAHAD